MDEMQPDALVRDNCHLNLAADVSWLDVIGHLDIATAKLSYGPCSLPYSLLCLYCPAAWPRYTPQKLLKRLARRWQTSAARFGCPLAKEPLNSMPVNPSAA